MEKKVKKPEIRFSGFTDDWEQRKLKDIATRVTRKNENLESTLPLTISAQYGLVDQITFFNNRIASKDVSRYYLIKNGEFAYNKSYSDGYPWGAIKRLERYEMGVLSTLYIVFEIHEEKVDSEYLNTFYDTNLWHKDVADRATEGARNHGLLNIAPDDFFDIGVKIPKLIEEQAMIGAYFKQLNNLITLHQRKYDKLICVKQSMLEKMFPKKGETKPEIRFKGFTEDWEQCKLGDVVTVYGGRDYKHLDRGDIPVYGTGGYMLSVSEALSNDRDAIGIGRKGTIDKPYILRSPFWTVDTLFYCIPNDKHDLDFTYDIFQNIDWKNMDESTGVPSLSKTAINEVDVLIPSEVEQKKIGEYFSNLDSLISLHQRKLELLKNLKKAMLEKMFV